MSAKLVYYDGFKYIFEIYFLGYIKSTICTSVEEIIVYYTGRRARTRKLICFFPSGTMYYY